MIKYFSFLFLLLILVSCGSDNALSLRIEANTFSPNWTSLYQKINLLETSVTKIKKSYKFNKKNLSAIKVSKSEREKENDDEDDSGPKSSQSAGYFVAIYLGSFKDLDEIEKNLKGIKTRYGKERASFNIWLASVDQGKMGFEQGSTELKVHRKRLSKLIKESEETEKKLIQTINNINQNAVKVEEEVPSASGLRVILERD